MFTKQVFIAEFLRFNIPYSHSYILLLGSLLLRKYLFFLYGLNAEVNIFGFLGGAWLGCNLFEQSLFQIFYPLSIHFQKETSRFALSALFPFGKRKKQAKALFDNRIAEKKGLLLVLTLVFLYAIVFLLFPAREHPFGLLFFFLFFLMGFNLKVLGGGEEQGGIKQGNRSAEHEDDDRKAPYQDV